jgi:hypothetical protein
MKAEMKKRDALAADSVRRLLSNNKRLEPQ